MAFPNSRSGGRGGRNFPNVQIRGGTVRYDQNGNKLPGEWSSNGPIGDPHNVWHPINYDPDTNTPQDRARIAQEQMDAQQAQGQRGAPLLQMNTRGQLAQAGGRADAVKGAPAATGTPLPEPHDSPVGQMRIGADARGTNPYYSRAAGQRGIGANNAPGTRAFMGPNNWTGPSLRPQAGTAHDDSPGAGFNAPFRGSTPEEIQEFLHPGSMAAGQAIAANAGENVITQTPYGPVSSRVETRPMQTPFDKGANQDYGPQHIVPAGAAPRTPYQQSQIDLQNQIIQEHPGIGDPKSMENSEFIARHETEPAKDLREIAASMYGPNPPAAPAPASAVSTATQAAINEATAKFLKSPGSGSGPSPMTIGSGDGKSSVSITPSSPITPEPAPGLSPELAAATQRPALGFLNLSGSSNGFDPSSIPSYSPIAPTGQDQPKYPTAQSGVYTTNRLSDANAAAARDANAAAYRASYQAAAKAGFAPADESATPTAPATPAPAPMPVGSEPGPTTIQLTAKDVPPPTAQPGKAAPATTPAPAPTPTPAPAPSASPTAFDPAGLPGLPSKAAQWAAALTGKPSEDGPGIVAQPHPTAGPLASPASPPAAASSARTTAPGAIPGASAADQAPRAVEASVAAKPAPADQPAAMRSGRDDSGNAISAAPMPGDARPDPHPSNVGQMRSGPNVGTNQNPLTQDALDDARSQLANRAINHQDFYNLTGRVDAHAAPSARNAAMSDLDSLHQSTAGNAASSTGAPQPQTPGGSMAGSTAVGRNDALSNAVTPGAGADSLTAQTTPGKIQYGGPTSNSDWARMFAPTPVADWSKIGSNHQVAAADSPALAPGPDDEDEKLKQLRAGTADSAAGGDNTTQSPAAQTQDIA